ncbi:hypothetical protein ACI43T_12055, partial [Neisseria oralis]
DFLRTGMYQESTTHNVANSIDDEGVSNAVYISPRINYHWNERWDFHNNFTYANLIANPTGSADFKKDFGFEWDIGLTYKPHANVRWVNELG